MKIRKIKNNILNRLKATEKIIVNEAVEEHIENTIYSNFNINTEE